MPENTNYNKDNSSKKDSQELGALWKKQSKNGGQKYLAGHIVVEDDMGVETKIKVVVFANREKKNERYPDFRILKSKDFSNVKEAEVSKAAEVSKEVEVSKEADMDEDVL